MNRKDTNEAEAKKSSSGSFNDLSDKDKKDLVIFYSTRNPDQTYGYTDSNGVRHHYKNGKEYKTT